MGSATLLSKAVLIKSWLCVSALGQCPSLCVLSHLCTCRSPCHPGGLSAPHPWEREAGTTRVFTRSRVTAETGSALPPCCFTTCPQPSSLPQRQATALIQEERQGGSTCALCPALLIAPPPARMLLWVQSGAACFPSAPGHTRLPGACVFKRGVKQGFGLSVIKIIPQPQYCLRHGNPGFLSSFTPNPKDKAQEAHFRAVPKLRHPHFSQGGGSPLSDTCQGEVGRVTLTGDSPGMLFYNWGCLGNWRMFLCSKAPESSTEELTLSLGDLGLWKEGGQETGRQVRTKARALAVV